MPRFRIECIDRNGGSSIEFAVADSEDVAVGQLRKKGFFVTSVTREFEHFTGGDSIRASENNKPSEEQSKPLEFAVSPSEKTSELELLEKIVDELKKSNGMLSLIWGLALLHLLGIAIGGFLILISIANRN